MIDWAQGGLKVYEGGKKKKFRVRGDFGCVMVTGPLDEPDSCRLAVLGGTGVGRSKTLP